MKGLVVGKVVPAEGTSKKPLTYLFEPLAIYLIRPPSTIKYQATVTEKKLPEHVEVSILFKLIYSGGH